MLQFIAKLKYSRMQLFGSVLFTLKSAWHLQLYPPMVFSHICIQSPTGEHSSMSNKHKGQVSYVRGWPRHLAFILRNRGTISPDTLQTRSSAEFAKIRGWLAVSIIQYTDNKALLLSYLQKSWKNRLYVPTHTHTKKK